MASHSALDAGLKTSVCPVCGLHLYGLDAERNGSLPCGRCQRIRRPVQRLLAAFDYAEPVSALIAALKFNADFCAGQFLAETLLARIRSAYARDGDCLPEAIIPVALHAQALRRRGYNQAQELARPLSEALRIPIVNNALLRLRATQDQIGLKLRARRRNVRGAFAVADPPGRHLALLDDVVTTGATVLECARVLKAAGAERIDVWCIARTQREPR